MALAAALLSVPAGTEAQVRDRGESVLVGRVTDRDTEDAVTGATIALSGLDEERVSGPGGWFELDGVPAGSYVLRVTRIGYEALTDTVRVPATSRVDLDIRLVPAAVELEPLVVVASYAMGGKMAAFYRRARTSQVGHFITRADIEAEPRAYVSGFLRRVRGLRVVQTRQGGMSMGNNIVMRGNCRPAIFIDGILTSDGGLTLDEMLQPGDLEGIEIYRGSETPAAFVRTPCGAILLWTRPGGSAEGTLPFWMGAAAAGVIAALVLLFAR